MALVTERKTIKKKAQIVEELNELFNKYDTIAIADLNKVRAAQLQQLAQKFRKDVKMKVVKNSIVPRVLNKNGRPNVEKLADHLQGSKILLFTNMDPFKLSLLLEKNKTKMTAKAGDIAIEDITIPAGNTGLPPGPAITELHDAGLRTKIDVGSVWVVMDAVVAKKGQPVPLKVASVLSKLGVKPFEIGLTIRAAFNKSFVFTYEQLRPKVTEIKQQFGDAVSEAFNLAYNSLYPTPLTVTIALQQAFSNSRNLAVNSSYEAPEVMQLIIARAQSHALSLASKVPEISKETASSKQS